ncbi:toprim domain-containing protein [Devosia sp. 2618]|uniref:toprim domain-containing protein n=1 Tax=Devosia sp. 2618 TaxID=3156454 RepID=UPI0033914159
MQRKIGDRAQGRWKEILPSLGVAGAMLTGKHGACPVCGGKDRFRFDDKGGKGTWFCAQQHGTESDNASGSAGNGFRLIMDMKGSDFADAARLVESVIGVDSAPIDSTPQIDPRHDQAETYAAVRAVWKSGKKIVAGDLADRYLSKRLGSYAPSRALRFHPALNRNGEPCAALISAFVDIHGDLAGLQRTYLTQYGDKVPGSAPRLTMGLLPAGGAVRLARHEKALGIAEGVETALAATALFGIPCWSALNAGRLETWEPPEGVTEIVIFGDNDLNNVGQAAAFALGKRLNQKFIAQVMIAPEPNTDWNDTLQAKLRGQA